MEDEFDILAAKVLAGEASTGERARLDALLSASAERRDEFAGLKAAWVSLKATAPISQSLEAPPVEIPEQWLRQLQQVVRERANAANLPATLSGESTAPSGARRAGEGMFASIWCWLQRRTGVAPVPFAAAVTLLCAAGAALWLLPSREQKLAGNLSNDTLAYLVTQRVGAEVFRLGKPLAAVNGVGLLSSDELRLGSTAQATLLTRTGTVAVGGPLQSPVSSLVPRAGQAGSDARLDKFQIALFKPASELLTAGLLVTTRGGQGIPLYSPLGATANLTPLILWKSEPGKTYDITITDEFDAKMPQWRARGVTSPLEFSNVEAWKGRALTKDGLYRVRISESARPLTACDYTFRTAENAGNFPPVKTADALSEAVQILTTAPSRAGDTLALLLRLPPEQANTELALRLKLLLVGQLGYQLDFDSTLARLQSIR